MQILGNGAIAIGGGGIIQRDVQRVIFGLSAKQDAGRLTITANEEGGFRIDGFAVKFGKMQTDVVLPTAQEVAQEGIVCLGLDQIEMLFRLEELYRLAS